MDRSVVQGERDISWGTTIPNATGIDEIFERLENKKFTAEWKYDGERAQVSAILFVVVELGTCIS